MAFGAVYQSVATATDQDDYPAPGQLVDVGGHRLHLLVMGAERGGPTVILESGLALPSIEWALVQPEIATFAPAQKAWIMPTSAAHPRLSVVSSPGRGVSTPATSTPIQPAWS